MPTMSKLFIASDHAGFELKKALVEHVHTLGYDVVDMGAATNDPEDDYPDFITRLQNVLRVSRTLAASSSAEADKRSYVQIAFCYPRRFVFT